MQLYTRAASSCSFRIRIALGVKKLKWEPEYVDNAKQQGETYRELNPQGLVPLLVDADAKIGQTMAIMEYLGKSHCLDLLYVIVHAGVHCSAPLAWGTG